jgi:hypothetical protein
MTSLPPPTRLRPISSLTISVVLASLEISLAVKITIRRYILAIVESFRAMVVTEVTSAGTFKKRQRLNSPSKLDDFLLDLTTEEEEREGKDVLSLFSSSRSNGLFKSYFRSKDKDSFPSSSSSSDHQAEVSGIDRLLNENEVRKRLSLSHRCYEQNSFILLC